ncbi:MAG TPA: hypothetical protein DHW82_05345 [Spirochaetia bacterium]|nr:hypothetical protein [Spirochaetia bacterium]
MLKIETEKKEDSIWIKLIGKATVEHILSLKESLISLLTQLKNTRVEILTSELTHADISFIQLLASLCRSFSEKEVTLHFQDPVHEQVIELIKLLGYQMYSNCMIHLDNQCVLKKTIDKNREKNRHE